MKKYKKEMLQKITTSLLPFGFALLAFSVAFAQDKSKTETSEPALPIQNEPGPSHPFGKLNPDAPTETAQFSFMVGEFSCDDKTLGQDGKWTESKVVWNSTYFLNGGGIQDRFWSTQVVATGTRIFDKKKGKWIVNYFQTAPAYFAGVWEGKKEGEEMIMRAPRGEGESRLTFHNITEDGFDWVGESVTKDGKASPFWIIACKRSR